MSNLRSIVVSGANQGLGYHTVHQLASTPNVLVFLGSRKLVAGKEAIEKFSAGIHPGSVVLPIQLDITDANSISTARDVIAQELKKRNLAGLDVLINNAGILTPNFEEVYAVNVFGTVNLTAALRPLMNKNGSILNISSELGSLAGHTKRPVPPQFPAYNSSKAALNQLTLAWAIEEEQKGSGVRVVSICPGYNTTNITGYAGDLHPSEGCKIIVRTALEQTGTTGVFFKASGPIEW
ncbi:Short-chain dehydrogenase/reductase family protein [Mycena indigotica]|uniref:Short-chain dehydrogenase/reductase family protein n=1 Tax=Mycena indigotica TaxID=2126181 RepID=A0A8H6S5P2_9AGAR|nr:Short-chain dehydrogenase/reductase family protein [Mycena indigotica]KAF7292808.1 Short-chain dehydrogenase/reductase family protein [Mycena indigotica]